MPEYADSNMEERSNALTVSGAVALAKSQLEAITVKIVGEVSHVSISSKYSAVYFTVKDEKSSLDCMMWNNRYKAQDVQLEEGQLVELVGRFTIYAAKGRMNFDVFSIELAGEGKLRMQVANLAKALAAEGLMAPERKRPIPAFPQRIGLVTSPRGAAVYDALRTLRRRYPLATILVAGVLVEGQRAPGEIIEGLRTVEDAGAEVILLVRGGGSFEDLMPFNDEKLARTIAQISVPVITGIGHEPDTSIADMVADLRASTPTAAAEAVAASSIQIGEGLASMASRLTGIMESRLESTRMRLDRYAMLPAFSDPMRLFQTDALKLDELSSRISASLPASMADWKAKLGIEAARLEALSPLAVLSRGYSIAKSQDGKIVRKVEDVTVGQSVTIQVTDGRIGCTVDDAVEDSFRLGDIDG